MMHRRFTVSLAAAMLLTGSALAQTSLPPLRTGVDGTFAPHAMPKLGGGVEGFQIDLFTDSWTLPSRYGARGCGHCVASRTRIPTA